MTIDSGFNHITVLLDEAVEALAVRPDGCYLDGTFGRGGHSRLILQKLGPEGRLLGFDKDPQAIATGQALAAEDGRFVIVQRSFAELGAEVAERGMALILISHDLGVISQNADRMLVMYGGSVVESGPTEAVFATMAHPYTRGLFAARPQLVPRRPGERTRLATIAGTVPELARLPAGCPFAGRCGFTMDACHTTPPPPVPLRKKLPPPWRWWPKSSPKRPRLPPPS